MSNSSNTKNYYKILNVERDSSLEEIKKSYKILIRKYHPDINPSEEAKIKSIEINEAYNVLSNNEMRKKYDKFFFDDNSQLDEYDEEEFDYEEFEELLESIEFINEDELYDFSIKELTELCDEHDIDYDDFKTKEDFIDEIINNLDDINYEILDSDFNKYYLERKLSELYDCNINFLLSFCKRYDIEINKKHINKKSKILNTIFNCFYLESNYDNELKYSKISLNEINENAEPIERMLSWKKDLTFFKRILFHPIFIFKNIYWSFYSLKSFFILEWWIIPIFLVNFFLFFIVQLVGIEKYIDELSGWRRFYKNKIRKLES